MRNSIVIIIFLWCIFLGLSFFINRDDFEKKENSLDEVVELEKAYQWAYASEITSQSPIEKANLNWYITRAQLAKMISSFSANILHKVPNTWLNCEFDDVDDVIAITHHMIDVLDDNETFEKVEHFISLCLNDNEWSWRNSLICIYQKLKNNVKW